MRISVDGAQLFFDVQGAQWRPDGPWLREVPTVVIVHTGPGADHTPYKEHVGPALAEVAQVLYIDLRGCGRSDPGIADDWNVERWSSDLRGLLQRLHVERPVILGAGWGAYTALRYAQRWPDELSKLALVNPTARADVDRIVARFADLGGVRAEAAAREFFTHPSDLTIAKYMRECFGVMVLPAYATTLMLTPIWNLPLAVHWTRTEWPEIDLRPGLSSIAVPSLVLGGTDDPQYPRDAIEEVVAALPDAEAHWFEGARHALFRDAPAAIDVVRRFVA
jgi:pimeloyl-ACP methyl ester carboxylesterase